MPNASQRALSRLVPLALGAAALAVGPAGAATEGYYSFPDISGNKIVFAAEGDLWTVSAEGGLASRLTTAAGEEFAPHFSPDGETVAFTGRYGGNNDVYVVPTDGGDPKRLTWSPYGDTVVSWSLDGDAVLFMSGAYDPQNMRNVWQVPATGGAPKLYPVGTASYLSINSDGKTVAFNRLMTRFATWKRYLGGTSDDIWMGDVETGQFKKATTYPGHDSQPMWLKDRLFFVSERDGRSNLWSFDKQGAGLKQHTDFTDFDVRWPESDSDHRIVFQQGADIRVYDAASDKEWKVDIKLATDRKERQARFVKPEGFLTDYDLSPDGKRIAACVRGDIYNLPVKAGRVVTLTSTSGAREYNPTFAGKKGDRILYWSDQTGEQGLYSRDFEKGGDEKVHLNADAKTGNWHFYPAVSPDGESVAFSNEEGTLVWENLTTQTLQTIDDSDVWELTDYSWSYDSRYIAYSKLEDNEFARVYVYDTTNNEKHPVTDPMFNSYRPTFDPEGKYLFYLSDRTFASQYGGPDYETVLRPQTRPYVAILAKDGDNPFLKKDAYEEAIADEKKKKEDEDKKKKDEAAQKEKDKAGKKDEAKKDDEKDKEKKETKIDWDGLDRRQVEVPKVPAQQMFGLTAAKGRLFYAVVPENRTPWDDDDHAGGGGFRLVMFNYTADKPKEETFADNVRNFTLNRTAEKIAVRIDDNIRVEEASAGKLGDEAPSVSLAGVRKQLNPAEEWAQIWQEAYRTQRDFYYDEKMTGVDWKGEIDRYGKLLDRISTRAELNDLIGNVIGELCAGHNYVWGDGDTTRGEPVSTGLLGADYTVDGDHYKFKKIYRGEPWNPELVAPLARTGVDVKEGDYLLSVNGDAVTTSRNIDSYFWGLGEQELSISVNDKPSMDGARTYRVKALRDNDTRLRYFDWVEANRKYVSERSGGRIGYLHLYDMGGRGLMDFFRYFFPQKNLEGFIIDDRFNHGGNVSQLIIARLRRVLYAYGNSRHFRDGTYPGAVFTGKMVCLINQNAGSDGDIFAYSFKTFKLGKLIGTRTWGGIVGIRADKPFVDGGQITTPEFGFWAKDAGYDIENYGVDPDVEIDITPGDELAGKDPQLEMAIDDILHDLEQHPVEKWVEPAKPDRSTPWFKSKSSAWMEKP